MVTVVSVAMCAAVLTQQSHSTMGVDRDGFHVQRHRDPVRRSEAKCQVHSSGFGAIQMRGLSGPPSQTANASSNNRGI